MDDKNKENIHPVLLGNYAKSAYFAYAGYVTKDRALPQIEDGLKPVHRRVLFAMTKMGITEQSKPVKSARVVGDVIGKYHPHGDSAVYETMVRMSQDFTLRYPLIDGQGNWGTRDGDAFAAQRYTECKLTSISSLLLDDIDDRSIDWIENYGRTKGITSKTAFFFIKWSVWYCCRDGNRNTITPFK
jgi:topoisomerase-4 subunit A